MSCTFRKNLAVRAFFFEGETRENLNTFKLTYYEINIKKYYGTGKIY